MLYSYDDFLQVSVDTLTWEFTVLTVDDSNLTGPPKVVTTYFQMQIFFLFKHLISTFLNDLISFSLLYFYLFIY